MPKRRKNRTHLKSNVAAAKTDNIPKSFVIKHGQVGRSVTQLVRDMRKVLEPNTAARLKERSKNKLKDYIVLAPALKVTHLLAFTLTPIAPSLRLVRLPAGPTLSFRVERYSLIKDILNSVRRPRSIGTEYLSPPLLVLASFPQPSPTTPPQLQLVVKALQSLFPPLSPKTLSLPSARRVVLVSYDEQTERLNFRHYRITVRPYGVSRRIQKIIEAKAGGKESALDLSNHQDVADFLLKKNLNGYESTSSAASSAGEDDPDNAVSLPRDYVGRNNKKGDRRAVRLDEIGPRMELSLIKIVESVPGKEGSVIYHRFVKKTKKEVEEQKAEHHAKQKLRKERKDEQERNVKKKAAAQKGKNKVNERGVSDDDDQGTHEDIVHDHDDGEWDDEEEISDGESDEEREGEGGEQSSDSEIETPPTRPILKKRKV